MMRFLAVGSIAALLAAQAAFLHAQDSPEPRKESVRAFSLRVTGDGHVEMTVQEDGKDRTYKADSMEEFTRQYPEIARKYGIGRGGNAWMFREHGDLARKLEELQKHFGDQGPDLRKLLERSEHLFQEPRGDKAERRDDFPAPNGPRLGVMLAPVGTALADQLGLDAKSGALIEDVEVGSPAEKSGLQKHDVLLKVDGKDVAGAESVRATVREALKKKEFDVEILRHGKKQTIKVLSPEQK